MLEQQLSLAEADFEVHRKKTRNERFLEEMEQVVPWQDLVRLIEPRYPKSGGVGRQPRGLEMMLRIYFVQQ